MLFHQVLNGTQILDFKRDESLLSEKGEELLALRVGMHGRNGVCDGLFILLV